MYCTRNGNSILGVSFVSVGNAKKNLLFYWTTVPEANKVLAFL